MRVVRRARPGLLVANEIGMVPYRTVLVGTDFSNLAKQVVAAAARLARRLETRAEIAHALTAALYGPVVEALDVPAIKEAMETSAKQELERIRVSEFANVESRTTVVSGSNAAMSIVDLARERDADLCVVGTHGSSRLERMLIGSVAEKIVRHAPCDVLTIPIDVNDRSPLAARILVATDFSETAERAIEVAAELAPIFDADVHVVHVINPAVPILRPHSLSLETTSETRARKSKMLASLVERKLAAVPRVTSEALLNMSTHLAITGYARDHEIELVVMGTHGRTGLSGVLLGSVAERTVRHASSCPVLVVRPRGTARAAT
jgi:nucleotide-binding universal stress UspA family protein